MVTPKYEIDGTVPSYLSTLAWLDERGFSGAPTFAVTVTNATLLNLAHLFNWLQNHDRDGFVQHCNLEPVFRDKRQSEEAMVARVKALLAPEDWRGRIDNPDTLFPDDRNPDRPWPGESRRVLPMLSINQNTCVIFAHPVGKLIGSADRPKFDLHWNRSGDLDFQVASPWDRQPTVKALFEACSHLVFGVQEGDNDAQKRRAQHKRTVLDAEGGEGEEVFRRVANWPVLAFLLWAAFDRAIDIQECQRGAPEPLEGWWLERIGQLEADVLDMADGLLQLAENVVLHAGSGEEPGRGVLALRVHNRPESWSQSPLAETYPRYFQGRDARRWINVAQDLTVDQDRPRDWSSDKLWDRQEAYMRGHPIEPSPSASEDAWWAGNLEEIVRRKRRREAVQQYLEVRVADCGTEGIPRTFRRRRQADELPALTDLRGFFDPTERQRADWRDYSTPENVVNHYGLPLFDSLLASLDGALGVASMGLGGRSREVYSSGGDDPDQSAQTDAAATGTRYSLLIPLRLREETERQLAYSTVGLRLNPADDSEPAKTVDIADDPLWRVFIERLDVYRPSSAEGKIATVGGLRHLAVVASEAWAGKHIAVFDAGPFDGMQLEVMCKAVLWWLNGRSNTHVAIRVPDEHRFRLLVRLLIMFFDRDGASLLNGNQIYLVGKDPGDEWWLPDVSLGAAVAAQLKLMSTRSVGGAMDSALTSELTRVLARRARASDDAAQAGAVTLEPFDLVVKATPDSDETLFDRAVRHVLTADIQDPEGSGCRLGDTHVRIGSKVHLDRFYEAKLLFENQYYVERYASRARHIMNQEGITRSDRCLIIGYETYSEMLALQVRGHEEAGENLWTYGILEDRRNGLRLRGPFAQCRGDRDENLRLVYLVPITVTMTTFRKVDNEIRAKALVPKGLREKPVLITAVHVRDSAPDSQLEKAFFTADNPTERTVELSFPGAPSGRAHYVHRVQAAWMDPLDCPRCFPPEGGVELPLAEPKQSPVVLSQLFGRKPRPPMTAPRPR